MPADHPILHSKTSATERAHAFSLSLEVDSVDSVIMHLERILYIEPN
jgi:hypothetical protein